MKKLMSSIKNHVWDWSGLTGYGLIYLIIIVIIIVIYLMVIGVNALSDRSCRLHSEITGLETVYTPYDACFVKNSEGRFVRYDSNYKDVK